MLTRRWWTSGGFGLIVWWASVAAASATVILPVEFDEMVRGSHTIVHGTVVAVEGQMIGGRRTIESLVTVDVHDALKGRPGDRVTLRVPGGQVGRYRRVMVGAPEFTEGDEVVLFLAGAGPAVPRPFGLSQGVYRVSRASGQAVVTPLVADDGRVVRGDPARRPLAIDAFSAKVRSLIDEARP